MNYWLHRISHHAEVSYPLLDRNILSIGFSDFSNQKFIDAVLKEDTWEKRWKVLERRVEESWGHRPRTRHNLWRFIDGFKKGDKIVIPSWGTFSVYELISEKPHPIADVDITGLKDWNENTITLKNSVLHRENDLIDLGFYWNVKPIAKQISRKDFADSALTSRMKIRMTNTNIFDIRDSVEKALGSFHMNKPINLYSEIIEKTCPKVLSTLETELSPEKFENLVKFYFERNGATEVYIPAKKGKWKEGDADVIAIFEPIKTIIYAQVKFHKVNSKTNKWAVEQIKDYRNNKDSMDDDYSRIAWVITSAKKYTDNCIKLARQERVHLIDGTRFAEMIIEAGIFNLNSAF